MNNEIYKVDDEGNILAKSGDIDWHPVFYGNGFMKKERAEYFVNAVMPDTTRKETK